MIMHQTDYPGTQNRGSSFMEMNHSPEVPDPTLTTPEDHFMPKFVEKLNGLDVGEGFLVDLALKAASTGSECTTMGIAERLHLGMMVVETLMQRLCDDKLIEKKGVVGLHKHNYAMLDRGWERVNRLMEACSYVGPAPVSLPAYNEMIVSQVRSRPPVTQRTLEKALSGLVLSESVKQTLGLVAS
jgi:hypothetical protein